MKPFSVVIGIIFLSACAAQPESSSSNAKGINCACDDGLGASAGCTDCPMPQDNQVCKSLSDEALKRCNCTEKTGESGSTRVKRWLFYFSDPNKSVKCECKISPSKDITFDFCPKDEDILGVGDVEYDRPIAASRLDVPTEFDGESFTEEQFDSEDFKCQPKKAFKLDCNTCWCNARGNGAKYCTRIACHPKVYKL